MDNANCVLSLLPLLLFSCSVVNYVSCAKILGIFPLPAYSHFSLGFKIMKELAARGHEVTFINPYPRQEKIKNYKDVSVAASIEGMARLKDNYYDWEQWSFLTKLDFEDKLTLFLTEETLKNENVQDLLKSNATFDLVLMEYSTTHPLMIFGHYSKCPVVILAPEILTVSNNIHFANPLPSSYVPNLFTGFTAPMSFWERLQNTLCNFVRDLKHRFWLIPELDKILKKYVNDAPDITDFLYNVSFMFLNSHPSFTDPIPLQFNIKEVGGFHVENPKPLPKDLQDYMNNASEGVVVFSMGSNLKSSDFPPDKLNAVLKGFEGIKEQVLWKFEEDKLPGKPENVRVVKWLPQNDILELDKTLKKYVNDAPDLTDFLYNVSFMFLNSHPSFTDPVPLQFNIKEVGGFHVDNPRPLPKDLQEYMNNASEGVVVFSMGSNLKSSDFPPDKLNAVLKGFEGIKEQVLWKFEEDKLPGKPENVRIEKWLPQNDILAHPNTKAFIGHGGILSTIETVYHGVPTIGLPVFWDQKQNMKTAAKKGYAVCLPFQELIEKRFSVALKEILENPQYSDNAKHRSKIMRSDPINQLDSVIFWLEYVLKFKNASHLESPGLKLTWYQRNLVDVFVFFFVTFVVFVYVSLFVLFKLFEKFVFRGKVLKKKVH